MTSPNPKPQDSAKATPLDWWLMVRKFLEQGTGVASFAPSSRFLARTMIKGIDYDKAKCIVELGAGTGSVTKEILARLRPQTKFMIVERDPDFCNRLRDRFAAYPMKSSPAYRCHPSRPTCATRSSPALPVPSGMSEASAN
jgi:hypothetical protein